MTPQTPPESVDVREALYNDRPVGPVWQIQLPREAVTRLHGLVIDLDADLLRPNVWFPPSETAETFFTAINPALQRHPVLRHAEVRDTGRWLHAIVWFDVPIELKSAADQKRWAALHDVLRGSVPSDPAAPILIATTRPVGGVNGKTGGVVRTLKQGNPIPSTVLEDWVKVVAAKPFETIATPLFGASRVAPCPFCNETSSHLTVGEDVGLCYGKCRRVPIQHVLNPFFKEQKADAAAAPAQPEAGGQSKKRRRSAGDDAAQVVTIDGDVVLRIDPDKVKSITIRLGKQ